MPHRNHYDFPLHSRNHYGYGNCRGANMALAHCLLMGMHRFFSVTAASVYLIPGMQGYDKPSAVAALPSVSFLHGHDTGWHSLILASPNVHVLVVPKSRSLHSHS